MEARNGEELSTRYEPKAIEKKWSDFWEAGGYFHSEPDGRKPYTIVIPPPNVTGVLHMGHMLNNTLQDVLVRRARMLGYNACWVPGTDHASIATEAKVVSRLKKQGIEKSSLSREEFLRYAWEWKEEHGDIILKQLRHLGASCDWARTAFTMDAIRSEGVIKCFVELYRRGLIYRGVRMVNWDPQAKTAVSDEEVVHREVDGKLYYVRYRVVGSDEYMLVATTRPETIMGDVAVCFNPEDERFYHLRGKRVVVPLVNREVPIIEDSYVDREFGTGALKITPAHDINDFAIGERHGLPSIDVFNPDGTISDAAGVYVGMDRFAARERSVLELQAAGLLDHVEQIRHTLGYSERTDSVIEPRLSMQWFLKMEDISKPALKAVEDGAVQLIPNKFVNTYRHWMENVRDWCISRQLWWGHRIPVWYLPDGRYVAAENAEEALREARQLSGDDSLTPDRLKQDEDVLDTWFSSWLWPISVFDGIRHPDNEEIRYYYPTQDLVTAPEILFFWVARMIIAGYAFRGEAPFSRVYLTGIVRDQQRRKMSKQLGNSPDPIALMEKYGTDGVRLGMLLCTSAGNDLIFEETLVEQGRNFCNKVWNAFRLVSGWRVEEGAVQPQARKRALQWFGVKLNSCLVEVERAFDSCRISDALLLLYRLFWDDFSGWLLELLKPTRGAAIDAHSKKELLGYFDTLLTVLHPFMPFLTEELWHAMGSGREGMALTVQPMPKADQVDAHLLAEYEAFQGVATGIRSVRQSQGVAPGEAISLRYRGECPLSSSAFELLAVAASVGDVEEVKEAPEGSVSFIVGRMECFVALKGKVDAGEVKKKLEEELRYAEGFLASVERKLANEKFVGGAPEAVVALERKKREDALAKIAALRSQLESL